MSPPLTAAEILAREFLEIRCNILDLAARLDRLERAKGTVAGEARWARIQEGIQLLATSGDDRAERVQLLFSRNYSEAWPTEIGLRK